MTDLSRNSMMDQNRNLAVRENLDGLTAKDNWLKHRGVRAKPSRLDRIPSIQQYR